MKSIYEYLDYRAYLADYYQDQKRRDPRFSYRVWADRAGFKGKDFIYRVMKGHKNLSPASAESVALAIGLSATRAEYFTVLVLFDQADSRQERERCMAALRRLNPHLQRVDAVRTIPHDAYELYSTWYHVVIRSLLAMYPFDGDFDWLAAQVRPAITAFKAKKSVELLMKLGLVSRDGRTGRYRVTEKAITTGEDYKHYALHDFYAEGARRAMECMEQLPRSMRHITGTTLGVSQGTYEEITRRIDAFRKEIAALANKDDAADRVVQLNVHLFPLSESHDDKDTDQ
jgi:uncharacterized protein (TIGR02147 family)